MRNTALLSLLLVFACKGEEKAPEKPPAETTPAAPEPDYVTVDHILIGVKGPGRSSGFPHTAAEAKTLAYDLLEKLEAGANWADVKQKYSDDKQNGIAGGPYAMANRGVAPRPGEYERTGMVPAFGDVGFALKVGEMRVADHGPTSPYGYHIIKRIK